MTTPDPPPPPQFGAVELLMYLAALIVIGTGIWGLIQSL